MEERENWGSKLGLILAMAGSSVGLGNFWRFPYQAAKNGGGAFMLPYLIALLVIGIPTVLVEWMQGRLGGKYGHGTIGHIIYIQARDTIKPKKAAILGSISGMMVIAVAVLVNSYYNHIIGWTLGYTFFSATGKFNVQNFDSAKLFATYIQSPKYALGFWIITLIIVSLTLTRGIQKGIEACAKIIMPVLYVFGIILIFKSLTLGSPIKPNWSSIGGLNYLWNPRWSELNFKSALAASGQIFYTLSIGMGIVQNYASYLKEDDDIVLSALTTIGLNEFAEVILGGTIVIPITFAFLGDKGLAQGVGLSFIAMPNIFRVMGGGNVFGTLWFLLLFLAGITSSIALYQYISTIFQEQFKISRKKATIWVFMLYLIVGLPVALESIITKTTNLVYFTELDNWVGNYLLLIIALIEIIVTGWFMKDKVMDKFNKGSYWKLPKWIYTVMIRFVTPIAIFIVLIGSTADFIKEGYFKLRPDFVDKAILVPWVNGARIVILFVLVIGFIGTYKSIKSIYGKEISSGNVEKQ